MRGNNRKSIEKCRKRLPQFTTMNVIDGQAGLVIYSSLIFYSLTIDNILNIIVLLILAGVTIAALTGENGILTMAKKAKEETERAHNEEQAILDDLNSYIENNGDTIFNTEKGVNKPKLTTGMIPVKWDTSKNGGKGNWVICSETDSEWYNYDETNKRWANVMLCDGAYDESTPVGTEVAEEDLGSMFVWIPRYAYKITSGYHDSPNGEMEVKFLVGSTDKTSDNSTVVEYNAETTNNYTKFQAGIKTTEKDTDARVASVNNYYYPVFKGRKYGYNYITESECYNISLALDDVSNPYGLTSNSNSHLMKDSEWGAVAYLSISQYGYSGGVVNTSTEKYKNNLYIDETISNPNNSAWEIQGITGYSATGAKTQGNRVYFNTSIEETLIDVIGSTNKSYAWTVVDNGKDSGNGTKSSTTGNIYGIYDVGGCLTEYTSAYVNNNAYIGNENEFVTGKSTFLATAYPNSGTIGTDFNTAYEADAFKTIYGNAIYEVSQNIGVGLTWFRQTLENDADGVEIFLPRGGSSRTSSFVGICGLSDSDGKVHNSSGFRSILIVE